MIMMQPRLASLTNTSDLDFGCMIPTREDDGGDDDEDEDGDDYDGYGNDGCALRWWRLWFLWFRWYVAWDDEYLCH